MRERARELLDEDRKSKSKDKGKSKDKSKNKPKSDKHRKHHAHNAELTSGSDTDSSQSESYQVCYSAKLERYRKAEKSGSVWFGDTGASAHMIDRLDYFIGKIKPLANQYVKLGGGRKLSVVGSGKAEIRLKGGKVILSSVLFVPGLGVSLVSGRQLCKSGLKGSFDGHGLYLHSSDGSLILEATGAEGVYMIS